MEDGIALETGHVGINVTGLERSLAFYEVALGLERIGGSDADGRKYAFLGTNGRLVLTLWEQSEGRFDAARPGLHHLSFHVATADDVAAAETRVRALGAKLYHDGVVPHAEGSASGGIFFEDPDGTRLEIFTAHVEKAATATATDGPACGFF